MFVDTQLYNFQREFQKGLSISGELINIRRRLQVEQRKKKKKETFLLLGFKEALHYEGVNGV